MVNLIRKLVSKALKGGFTKKATALLSPVSEPLELLPDCPELFKAYRRLIRHPELERVAGGGISKGRFYPDYLTVGGAGCAIFRVASGYCKGKGIDIGAGYWPLPGAIPLDTERGPGVGRTVSDFDDGSLDCVFSSHCLEHIVQWRSVLAQWVGKLKPGGIVFLYLPHPECGIWHPGSPFVGDGHKWVPTPEAVSRALQEMGFEVVEKDEGPDAMMSFYICARKGTSR